MGKRITKWCCRGCLGNLVLGCRLNLTENALCLDVLIDGCHEQDEVEDEVGGGVSGSSAGKHNTD